MWKKIISILIILGILVMLSGCTMFNPIEDQPDVNPPEFIDRPTDDEIYEDEVKLLIWRVKEENPLRYEILINGELKKNTTWDGTNIEFSTEGLEPGTYFIVCRVFDQGGRNISDEAKIVIKSELTKIIEESTPLLNYIILFASAISALIFITGFMTRGKVRL